MTANQQTKLQKNPKLILKGNTEVLMTFIEAANTFIKHEHETVEIWAASRDWFLEEWGRDTFISLPGLLLSTKRFGEAREVFRHFSNFEHAGIIPNRIQRDGIFYNTVDASLWFIYALHKYLLASEDYDFLKEMMPTVRTIVHHYKRNTHYDRFGHHQIIEMDPEDGLIICPLQSTWMDANPTGERDGVVTPRHGKAVEINVLWHTALVLTAEWEELMHDHERSQELKNLARKVKASFNDKFWNAEEKCLYDVIEGDPHGGALRPNQIIAISHGRNLLPLKRQQDIFKAVTKDLLTPGGLRTLSPRDSYYRGVYETEKPMHEKDLAYHQGTVWPWLIGPYCDALVKVRQSEKVKATLINSELEKVLKPLVYFCLRSEYKSLPEVFSGSEPFDPGGTTSQAWSIAEVMRILIDYKLL